MDSKPGKKKYKRKEDTEDSNSAVTLSISSIGSTIKLTETTRINRPNSKV